jgi:hypothetical protein
MDIALIVPGGHLITNNPVIGICILPKNTRVRDKASDRAGVVGVPDADEL